MATQVPNFGDSEWDLLAKILLELPNISGGGGGGGSGDVVGPGAAVNNDIAVFDGVTGKLLKDGGTTIGSLQAAIVAAAAAAAAAYTQAGAQAIGNGVATISIVFGAAFAAVPTVVGSISRPVAEDTIGFNIDQASITVNGFTVTLMATTGSANYKFNWIAK